MMSEGGREGGRREKIEKGSTDDGGDDDDCSGVREGGRERGLPACLIISSLEDEARKASCGEGEKKKGGGGGSEKSVRHSARTC